MRINLSIDEDLWIRFRMECLQKRIPASKAVSRLLQKQLGAWGEGERETFDEVRKQKENLER